MIGSNPFNGVCIPGGISGISWTTHAPAAAAHAAAAHAMPRKRRIAAATPASVNRGTT